MSEVTGLLERYAAGTLTLAELAAVFAARRWEPDRPGPSTYEQAVRAELLEDPGLIPPDSWLEVEAAYVAGEISDGVYAVLYAAATGGRARP